MAEEAPYYSGTDSAAIKRKYEDSTAPPPPSSARRATGFSAAPPSDSALSYNSVPPPMDEIQLAKQKAQEIAARLFNNAEAKRPKFENGGGGWDDNRDFSSGTTGLGPTIPPMPSSYGYGTSSKKVEIPSGRVGVIIGKAGETIKYLQQQSGAKKIQVTRDMDADPHSLTRDVEIIGSADSIAKAEELIKEVLAEAESGGSGAVSRRVSGQPGGTEQFVMQIPNKKVGLVIGKGGETIKNMQATSGARIQVIPLHLPPGDTSTERTVQIDGSSEQIEAAKQLVNEVISDNRQRNSMGGGYSQPGQQPGQQMQQPGYYGYTQPGAYSGQPAQYTQQTYGSYPQQTPGGYAASWDQSPAQQTTQGGGYDYYGQQQSQQTQPPGAPGSTDTSGYSYGQQGQSYGQDGYGGYSSAPQSGYGQTSDGQSQTQSQTQSKIDGNQAPASSAPQSGYSQQPGQNPSYPPSSQTGYGSQASGYGGYGGYGAQQPPAYGQQSYGQPPYGAPPAYGGTGYGQPPYGAPASYGGQQPPAYGGSYGGGYQQPPAYSSDAGGAPGAELVPKGSPEHN